jgi:hypothetical protein
MMQEAIQAKGWTHYPLSPLGISKYMETLSHADRYRLWQQPHEPQPSKGSFLFS